MGEDVTGTGRETGDGRRETDDLKEEFIVYN